MIDVKTMGRMARSVEDPAMRRLMETMIQNIDILHNQVEEIQAPPETEWFNIYLLNGWVQFGDPFGSPKYYKDAHNVVHLAGMIKSGTATGGTIIFNLPEGYRPEQRILLDVINTDTDGRIDIDPAGNCRIMVGGNTYLSLDGLVFDAFN